MKALPCAAVVVLAGLAVVPWVRAADKDEKVDVRGAVGQVSPSPANKAGVLGSILVEGVKEKTTRYDKAAVRITAKTTIEKVVGKKRQRATFADLKEGVRVEAIFTGPVAESYPVQATAKAILILE